MSKMENAISGVKFLGLSASQAARKFNVAETTLRAHLKKLGIVAKLVSIMVFFFQYMFNNWRHFVFDFFFRNPIVWDLGSVGAERGSENINGHRIHTKWVR
jgi:hypothetical protein